FLSRYTHGTHRALHSFPTRRSSDLEDQLVVLGRAISADTRRENLNKPPALGGMLVDGLLIAVFPGLPDLHDPFPEAYKLVFVMLLHRHIPLLAGPDTNWAAMKCRCPAVGAADARPRFLNMRRTRLRARPVSNIARRPWASIGAGACRQEVCPGLLDCVTPPPARR